MQPLFDASCCVRRTAPWQAMIQGIKHVVACQMLLATTEVYNSELTGTHSCIANMDSLLPGTKCAIATLTKSCIVLTLRQSLALQRETLLQQETTCANATLTITCVFTCTCWCLPSGKASACLIRTLIMTALVSVRRFS